jgi:hypothetical protein
MISLKSILTLLSCCAICLPLAAQNLVTGGDFENGMGSWFPWFVDETASWAEPPMADAEFSVTSPGLGGSDKALFVEVIEPGKSDWYILVSKAVPLEANEMYDLSLRGFSDVNRTISVGVFENIASGSPFFTQVIDISNKDRIYGPFPFLYEPHPVNPGIKIQFGGMEGDVLIDDVVIRHTIDESDYTPYNSLEDIIGDITLPHEGLPHGVPDSYDWAKGPRRGAQRPPDGWTAAIAWGQLYEWAEGNPAINTRVQIRDMEMYYLSKIDNQWHQMQKSLRVDGAAYVEDFVGDVNKPADIRSEPDGSISVTAGDGYNFHFWPSAGRVVIPKDEVEGCFVTLQCRLILDDPNGVDDRREARYLMSVGGDWWESLTAQWDNWTTNRDMGIGRFRFVTTEWRGYNMISLTESQVRENPPPYAGSTVVQECDAPIVQDFRLEQNYPNPFNPSTTIRYQLTASARVRIQVFDLFGRVVDTLVDEHLTAGRHSVRFEGNGLPSGTYFCKMTADDFQMVRKLLLIR